MTTMSTRVSTLLALLLIAGCFLPALAADELFDLRIQLRLDDEVKALLHEGDRFEIVLAPASKYGPESTVAPVVLERSWSSNNPLGEWHFSKALVVGQIYEIELKISRGDQPVAARYLCALDRLPRRPADSRLTMRLVRGHASDHRNTLVLVNRDSDGIYRISVFTA